MPVNLSDTRNGILWKIAARPAERQVAAGHLTALDRVRFEASPISKSLTKEPRPILTEHMQSIEKAQ